jgi:hypothetical protein
MSLTKAIQFYYNDITINKVFVNQLINKRIALQEVLKFTLKNAPFSSVGKYKMLIISARTARL